MSHFARDINSMIILSCLNLNYCSPDINECELDLDNCDEQATCTNTEGSYTCLCNAGWTGSGDACEGRI